MYQLAADMGGIGYITEFRADVARNNVLINAHMLEAAHQQGVGRYFFSSSACIYPMYRQESPDVTPLKEEHAYPADPEEGYGWEKLYAEKLCQYYREEGKIPTTVARFHNIYGPLGTYVRRSGEGTSGHLPQGRVHPGRRGDRGLGRWRPDEIVHLCG